MKIFLFALVFACTTEGIAEDRFPSWSTDHAPPADFPNPFKLSQDYPEQPTSEDEKYPWETFDFQTQSDQYMTEVLKYALAGNDIHGEKAPVDWFHAPWLHAGCRGREYIHGLTNELTSPPRTLHPNQTDYVDNWAIGLFNRTAAYTIGQVWKDAKPVSAKADFPRGSVAVKFLFTTATPSQAPFLEGSPTWNANVYPPGTSDPCKNPKPRENRDVRLLQVDIAVRESRLDQSTGWVFGTFIYSAAEKNRLQHLVPVGLMWSNDKDVEELATQAGAFKNDKLKGTWINESLLKQPTDPSAAFVTHLGLGGRLNGPVDNPISSCLSCHASAAEPTLKMTPTLDTRPANYPIAEFATYFTDIKPGPITEVRVQQPYTHLDYSLQLAIGIRNFGVKEMMATPDIDSAKAASVMKQLGPEIDRSGKP